MTKVRGPEVRGTLVLTTRKNDTYVEKDIAQTWARGMMRTHHPRCTFKEAPWGVAGLKKGELIGVYIYD